ncbi:hypothetical protein IJD34_00955 [bacterium]|nr:hypothetical protein [bacterium]
MKIFAINNQIASKGLYTDKTKENNGNWKMTYKPYSWELNDAQKPYIAPKKEIDLYSSTLPTNDEFYTEINGKEPARSIDIFGTTSYYKYPANVHNGEMRRNVIQEAPMNREESLEVYKRKLGRLLSLKEHKIKYELPKEVNFDKASSAHTLYKYWSNQYDDSFLFGKNSNKDEMESSEFKLYRAAMELHQNAQNYIRMNESIRELKENIENIDRELSIIKNAKKENLLIDISKRDGDNADNPLKIFIEKVANSNKPLEEFKEIIALPNKTIRFTELLAALNNYSIEGSISYINLKNAGLNNHFQNKILYVVKQMIAR